MAKLLTNESIPNMKESLIDALERCDAFMFSVSFIKYAGLRLIQNSIEEALNKGVKGRIITSL